MTDNAKLAAILETLPVPDWYVYRSAIIAALRGNGQRESAGNVRPVSGANAGIPCGVQSDSHPIAAGQVPDGASKK